MNLLSQVRSRFFIPALIMLGALVIATSFYLAPSFSRASGATAVGCGGTVISGVSCSAGEAVPYDCDPEQMAYQYNDEDTFQCPPPNGGGFYWSGNKGYCQADPACVACVANSGCAANTCTTATCSDSCGNVYAGTKTTGECAPPPPPTCADSGQQGTYPSCWTSTSCSASNSCGQVNYGTTVDQYGSCSVGAPSEAGCGTGCVSYQGQTCGVSSSCGSASGTYQCDGSCSATAPSVPSNYGQSCVSSANSCGMTNTGTRTCGGTCTVSTPPDSACTAPAGTCTSPTISSFTVTPNRVRSAVPTDLTFAVSASGITTSCVITGPGVNQAVAASSCNASGSVTVPDVAITSQATYTLTCDSTAATARTNVNVIPKFEPF